MAAQVNIHEAKTHLSRLIARVEAGEEIVIAKAGVPRVRLVAIPREEPRRPGRFAGELVVGPGFFEPLPEAELAAWEAGAGVGN